MVIRLSNMKIGHNSVLCPSHNRYSRLIGKYPYLHGTNWQRWGAHRHCFEFSANPARQAALNKSLARNRVHFTNPF